MARKKPKRKAIQSAKTDDPPKFLLETESEAAVNALKEAEATAIGELRTVEDETPEEEIVDSDVSDPADAEDVEIDEIDDEDWPERDDIRNGLIGHVRKRFGIDPEVAERAINDILRIA